MIPLIVDASVAVKWLIQEEGSAPALALRQPGTRLIAPDLLMVECANILWKKVRLGELSPEEAGLAARLVCAVDMELVPTRHLADRVVDLTIALDHPAYDRLYLAVALDRDGRFVTADQRFVRKVAGAGPGPWQERVLHLADLA